MSTKKVISKGYTVEVVSWENDGDNFRTKSKVFDTLEVALSVRELCNTLFKSCNNRDGGLGNRYGQGNSSTEAIILEHVFTNSKLWPCLDEGCIQKLLDKYDDSDDINDFSYEIGLNEDSEEFECMSKIVSMVEDLNYNLQGSSEFYEFRVTESCTITYSPKDVHLDIIE